MAENAVARHLASYIKERENVILKFSPPDDCDVISEKLLLEVIIDFYEQLAKF